MLLVISKQWKEKEISNKEIRNHLSKSYVQVNDDLEQNMGVLQGEPPSPLLLNLAVMDAIKVIKKEKIKVHIYADDMAEFQHPLQ